MLASAGALYAMLGRPVAMKGAGFGAPYTRRAHCGGMDGARCTTRHFPLARCTLTAQALIACGLKLAHTAAAVRARIENIRHQSSSAAQFVERTRSGRRLPRGGSPRSPSVSQPRHERPDAGWGVERTYAWHGDRRRRQRAAEHVAGRAGVCHQRGAATRHKRCVGDYDDEGRRITAGVRPAEKLHSLDCCHKLQINLRRVGQRSGE